MFCFCLGGAGGGAISEGSGNRAERMGFIGHSMRADRMGFIGHSTRADRMWFMC